MTSTPIDKPGSGKQKTSTGYESSEINKGKKGGAVPTVEGPNKLNTKKDAGEVSGPSAQSGTLPQAIGERTYHDQPRSVPKARRIRDGVNTGPGITHKDS